MLFFVDESFQNVGGIDVGSLGAVAIPPEHYNHLCRQIYKVKRDLLGATELHQKELKGNTCLTKAQFKRESEGVPSDLLATVDALAELLVECEATVFGIWTRHPELLTLRKSAATTQLTLPYIRLLHYFAHVTKFKGKGLKGHLYFDQMGNAEDMHAACTIANYLARPRGSRWLASYLIQVPHYTHSAVSPGLQAADLVAYLAAQQIDTTIRPELKPWWERFDAMAWYQHGRTGSGAPQLRKTTGELVGMQWHTGPVITTS